MTAGSGPRIRIARRTAELLLGSGLELSVQHVDDWAAITVTLP